MSAEHPNQPSSRASLLIVGLGADVVARIAAIAAPHGIEARATSLAKLHADTAKLKPIVVLVDGYLYDFDPRAFDKLAADVGAKLGVVGSAKDADELLTKMLRGPTSVEVPASDRSKSVPPRHDFETAKYDMKTLHDALERMQPPRAELTTAKYDRKTLHEALKRMNPEHMDAETAAYDAKTLNEMLEKTTATAATPATAPYDVETLRAALHAMKQHPSEAATAHYDAHALLQQIRDEDET